MKKSRFAKKMMALILAVVTAVTLMPVNGFMSKVKIGRASCRERV